MNWVSPIFILVIAFVAVFGQAWFDGFRNLFGVQIDLLPALMVYTGLTSSIFTVALLAVCGGLWFDSLSANPLGVSVLPLFVIGFLIYEKRDLLLREHPFAQMVLGMAASLTHPLLTLFLLMNIESAPLLGWKWIWQLVVLTVAGAVMTPVCFRLFDRIHQTFNYQPVVQTTFRPDREIKRGRDAK